MTNVMDYAEIRDILSGDDVVDYANTDNVNIANVSKLLESTSLEKLLDADKEQEDVFDERVQWYHGELTRENAENILKEASIKLTAVRNSTDGLFLVRFSGNKYSLSMVLHNDYAHYLITEKSNGHYKIETGDSFFGLDYFIEQHSINNHGIATKLTRFCKGKAPPVKTRRTGYTNLLHRAVLEGKVNVVEKILKHSKCPNIDAKNVLGKTALHTAVEEGYLEIVKLLIKYKANVSAKDINCHTALQRAAKKDFPSIISTLIYEGHADPCEKGPTNNWVALHEAAVAGNIKALKVLLEITNCPHPKTNENETPYDIAIRYGRNDCAKELENFKLPDSIEKIKVWYHSGLDREGAERLCEMFGRKQGIFIIRKSTKGQDCHCITVCHNEMVKHYVINSKTYMNKCVYYVDDSPYFWSLQHLVYYYSRWPGFVCKLEYSITTNLEIEAVLLVDEYYNLSTSSYSDTSKKESNRPSLPSRIEPSSPVEADIYAQPLKPPSSRPPVKPKVTTQLSDKGPKLPESVPPSRRPESPPNIIKEKNIKFGNLLGEGEYGSVLRGVLTLPDKSILSRHKKIDVAIKTFHEGLVGNEDDFLQEAKVMKSLNHPCITKLLGVCHGKQLMLIEEFVPMGSMLTQLIDYPERISVKKELYLWAGQIAQGMEYLESQKVVHRDLAARNILLASYEQIKISDFGLSRATCGESDYYKASKGGRWPIKWYAPESVNYGKFTHASDVWSYGVTLWEMFSFGDTPYGEKKGIEVIQEIERGRRLNCPKDCPQYVFSLMQQCWKFDPPKRPKFSELIQFFLGSNDS